MSEIKIVDRNTREVLGSIDESGETMVTEAWKARKEAKEAEKAAQEVAEKDKETTEEKDDTRE